MKLLLLILTSLWIFVASAAESIRDFPYGRYNISYITVKNGLPHNHVNDFFSDSNGFVWVATYGGGLVRYDGYGFIAPGIEGQSLQMRSNSCKNISEDRFRRLWVCFDENTRILDLNTMMNVTPHGRNIDIQKILSEPSIRSYTDTKGKIWLVTKNNIYHFDFDAAGDIINIAKHSYTNNTPDVRIKDIYGDGSVWASIDGGIYRLVYKNGKIVRHEISPVLRNIHSAYISDYVKRHHFVWIATNVGLYRYNMDCKTLKYYTHDVQKGTLSHEYVSCLAVTGDDHLLAGTLAGVNIYNDASDSFSYWNTHSLVNPLNSDFVHCLYAWNGLLFIGTETGGIIKLSPRKLLLHNMVHGVSPQSLSPNCVNAMYAEHNGTLWVGTVEGGLNRRAVNEKGFSHFTQHNSRLSHNSVSTLANDNRGRLWIGTWGGGMNVMDMNNPASLHPLTVDRSFVPLLRYVGALAYDPYNDGLWIGSNDGLYFYNYRTQKVEEPFADCRLVRGCIGSIIDNDGNLWVGCLEGVRVVNLKSRTDAHGYFKQRRLKYKLDNPKSGIIDKITSFCQTKDGTLWLGSDGYGLYQRTLDKQGKEYFKVYTTQDGLANNSIKGLVADNKGMLWITTNNGLSEFDPKKEIFTNFTEKDGLLSSQFYWNSAIRDASGMLYFGTEKGLIEMKGLNVGEMYKGKLTFTRLIVDNININAGSSYLDKDISVAKKINLHESNKSLSIEFSALNYGTETEGVYSYRMKGFDDEWTKLASGEHSIHFTRLPAGDYTIQVRYISPNSPIKELDDRQILSIHLRVNPYFWHSWWFITLVASILAVITIYLYNKRVKTLRRRTVEELYKPIEKAMSESNAPERLQKQIQGIINAQRRVDVSTENAAADVKLESTVPFMDRVMAMLEKNYQNSEFDVNDMSSELGVSRSVLGKRLNEETGMAAAQFLRHYRLDIAYKLLNQKEHKKNVTEIAFKVGFNDPKYFTRCFTKEYGAPPSKLTEN